MTGIEFYVQGQDVSRPISFVFINLLKGDFLEEVFSIGMDHQRMDHHFLFHD
jgi:hypothetical protein